MKKHTRFSIALYCIIFFSQLKAQVFVEDQANILNQSDISYLNELLKTYAEKTSTEVAIRIVESLDLSKTLIHTHAHQQFEGMQLGQQGVDNGILIYYSHKNHQVDIELGYGIEPYISDMDAKKIIEEVMLPNFQKGNFYKGFQGALYWIQKYLQHAVFISPQRDTFVIDEAKLLRDFEIEKLEKKLKNYFDQTGHHIWIRIIQDEQSDDQARKIAKSVFSQLHNRKDDHYQTLYYIGVNKDDDQIHTYPRIEHNWLSLAYEIESSYDYYASKYRSLGDASGDVVTFRLEEVITEDLFALHKYHQGVDLVIDFMQKIHRKEIKASNDIKGPFSLRSFFSDPLFFTLLMFGIPIVAFFFFARGGISGYAGASPSSGNSNYPSSSNSGNGGWESGGNQDGFGGGRSSQGDNENFGGGSSGGAGASGEF